jgi:head-tail adaptor
MPGRRAGGLDEVIVLQEPSYGDAGAGTHPLSWSDMTPTIRGEVVPGAGRETTVAQQLEGSQLYTVRIYRRADITPAHRLKILTMGDLLLNVRAANDPGPRERFQTLLCEAGTAQ